MLKITTWNGEWLEDHWGVVSGKYPPGSKQGNRRMPQMARAQSRIAAFKELAQRIGPHILFVCEGPVTEGDTAAFAAEALPDHRLVTRPAGQDSNVQGDQGLWFFVRKSHWDELAPTLLDNPIWRAFTHLNMGSSADTGRWWTVRPRLRTFGATSDVSVNSRRSHGYYRHPQVLRFTFKGETVEIIGVHLKSKRVNASTRKLRPGESFGSFAKEARVHRYLTLSHEARVKLTSEAANVRAYIDHRFDQEADPAILVLGDVNDGPGKELLEREYLLHDMISNLQGDIFFAQRMLYHALFDQPSHLRWTVEFEDKIDPDRDPRILLDHILYTQSLNRTGNSPLRADGASGRVEHRHHDDVGALFGEHAMSDHRPVSLTLLERGAA